MDEFEKRVEDSAAFIKEHMADNRIASMFLEQMNDPMGEKDGPHALVAFTNLINEELNLSEDEHSDLRRSLMLMMSVYNQGGTGLTTFVFSIARIFYALGKMQGGTNENE